MQLNRRHLLFVAALLFGGVAVFTPCQRTAADDAPRQPAASLRAAAQAEVESAGKIVASLDERERANEALTPEFLEEQSVWGKRLRDARVASAETAEGKRKAAEDYLQTCRARLSAQQRRVHIQPIAVAKAEYDVAEAEFALASLAPH